jgi:hypothetical protein
MSAQNLRLRTRAGPVGLREKRKEPQKLKIQEAGDKLILAGWLKDEGTSKDEKNYHICIKQAMLLAARWIDLNDAQDPGRTSAEGGYGMPDDSAQYQDKIARLQEGKEKITVAGHKKVEMKKILRKDDKTRHLLVKYSKRCCCDRRERSFIIDNGELVIYKSQSKNAKISYPTYKMKDALITFEYRMAGTYPKPRFDEGYQSRVKCVFPEREQANPPKGPFYLYPKDSAQLNSWKRAFQLARVLVSDNDRRALKVSIGRASSASLIKGWDALAIYFKEIAETRRLVKQMALRLMKIEYSRGWSKMKLVNQKIDGDREKRKEQQIWAARFMSEKLARIATANAKKASDVRESVITRIQQKFRHYRDEKIFDRQYPIGSKIVSRMRQARQGCQMDVALDVLTCEEVLMMSLKDKRSLERLSDTPETLATKKSTYSEVNIPAAEMLLSVSDNLQSIAFTAPTHTADAWSHLTKSDWSNFVNLDRISQVVLHTAPHLAIKRKEAAPKGVWCTVYGPKIAWGKRIDVVETKDGKQLSCNVVGADNGFAIPKVLSQKFGRVNPGPDGGIRWVSIAVSVKQAEWSNEVYKAQREATTRTQTLVCVHILGYRFTSKLLLPTTTAESGKTEANYGNSFNPPARATIPIAAKDDAAFVALDNSVLGVEIFEVKRPEGLAASIPTDTNDRSQLLTGAETLWNIIRPAEGTREQSYRTGVNDYELLLAPPEIQEGAKAVGKVKISLSVNVENDNDRRDEKPVSPEFVGAGILTSLYSSHRGAWHDNELAPGQFRLDHVANFVELSLSGFRFPNEPKPLEGGDQPLTYKIRATMNGISTTSPPMHRASPKWATVLGPSLADAYVIKFNGIRLCLPLPPGCWGASSESKRPILELEVIQGRHEDIQVTNYTDYEKSVNASGEGPPRTKPPTELEKAIFKTALTFDGIVVDQVRQVSAFFGAGSIQTGTVLCDVFANQVMKGQQQVTEAVLNLDFALRDRDFIKSSVGNPPSESMTVCVGDKALISVEEPLMYPASEMERKGRNHSIDAKAFKNKKDKVWDTDKKTNTVRGCPLRDPCLSSEYAASGLESMIPKVPFKQHIIPNYCTDIIPHKYVLPFTEQQFRQERRPGIWPHVLDDLAAFKQASGQIQRGSTPAKSQVTHLTKIERKIPVILLATYPNGTCDVEVASEFMENWAKDPSRRYAMPGKLLKGKYPPPAPKANAQPDQKPPPVPFRAILKQVSIASLVSVHGAGFHVFDADLKDVKDVKEAESQIRVFNPRDHNSTLVAESHHVEDFSIVAGPLPADASPASCQYEWSLHVRSPSEYEMHKFVAMLRQCVRVDHHQSSMKMRAFQEAGEEMPAPTMQYQRATGGGQLEVVLVEARRLQALGVDKTLHDIKKVIAQTGVVASPAHESKLKRLQSVTTGEMSKSTPDGADITTIVNFRMRHLDETLAFKSQRVQSSPPFPGTDSPCWATLDELKNSGGWTFKTGLIAPEKLDDLVISFEVNQVSMGIAQTIGQIELGVSQRPNLINPKEPFKNLWLPLLSEKNGVVMPNKTGELHVMTRWLPVDKLYLPPGQQQVTVRSQHLKELWSKVCAQRLKEPIYQLEAQYLHYNPNLVRVSSGPETPSNFTQRHTEDLHSTMSYLECLERRQSKLWEKFDELIHTENLERYKLAEVRLKWLQEVPHNSTMLTHLHELIEGGIPSARRQTLWLDLTMASRVLEREGLGQPRDPNMDPEACKKAAQEDYKRLLDIGLPQRSDANTQLQEDAFHLAAWESTTPPIAEHLDFHLRRLKSASNVCTALIAYERSGVAYCESLLIVAFFLLLPQGFKEERNEEGGASLNPMPEYTVFWLLYTLIGTRVNGTFKEYYGKPEPMAQPGGEPAKESLCVTSGAMHDVSLLECCLSYHEFDVWCCMSKLGFQLSTVFYNAFMRLYATVMPTATVFRFWDMLFSQSSHPKAEPSGRVYLVDLAFGVIRAKRSELLQCESALEIRQLILGVFGSLYDTSTVVELTLASHKALWEGNGFSAGKVGHLWTQRDEMFRMVNDTFHEQNDILRVITHERPLGRIPMNKYDSNNKGVTTKELLKDVLPVMQQSFETLRPKSSGSGKYWAMHRPMPLVAKALAENSMKRHGIK